MGRRPWDRDGARGRSRTISSELSPKEMTLHDAVYTGTLTALRARIAASEPIETRDDEGRTPLMIAAEMGRIDVLRALTEAGSMLGGDRPERARSQQASARARREGHKPARPSRTHWADRRGTSGGQGEAEESERTDSADDRRGGRTGRGRR